MANGVIGVLGDLALRLVAVELKRGAGSESYSLLCMHGIFITHFLIPSRACNSPPPSPNGGAPCEGEDEDTRECGDEVTTKISIC